MAKKSKRYLALLEKAEAAGELKLDDAVKVLKEFDNTGFDQTIEIHMHLGVDSTQADQIIRGAIGLPHGCAHGPSSSFVHTREHPPTC